ncbi:extracellular solute-binding protein [Mesorhizobium sp. M1005]|uniref:extracellular solute-binding protein n=1 Tax=unclassified Mesorhizobium TaxID=325217 RepID=UPI00333BFD06
MAALPRRDFLALGGAAAAAALLPGRAFATIPTGVKLHGLSAFGDLKYPPDFTHFDYVNPDAPKGGRMNFGPPNSTLNQSFLTFNTLNSLVLKGDSPPRTELCFDSLMARALDEPDAVYGVLAESVTLSQDRNGFRFSLRPQARFHDGSPLTAEDVAFALNLYKDRGHPNLSQALRHMTDAVAIDPLTVSLTFNGKQSAQNILAIAVMPIVSKAFYTANDFDASTMTPPLSSGPYKMGRVVAGQTIEYERVADYWGRDLAVNRGLNNFDRIRIDFYLDRQAAFEAFKKGDTHFREEFTARVWATGYDFPALKDGRVVKREFPGEKSPDMQAVALNQRRPQFRDVRVRQAIAYCFDFEWTKRVLFFGSYERSQSNFERSDYKAEGLPSPQELKLLEPFRAELPPETFGEPVVQPVSDGSGHDRKLLREASRLLAEAGWKRAGNFVVNEKGERLRVEMLAEDEGLVRIFAPWSENMKAIGIDASIRQVDSTQFEARQSNYDFDFNMLHWLIGATPTADGLEILYNSGMAKTPGMRNYPGTESKAIDALIEAAGKAQSRIELVTALNALDRVLRARLDWIPTYHLANHRAAFWDMFGFPAQKPDYDFPVEALWWFDKDKAAKIGKA